MTAKKPTFIADPAVGKANLKEALEKLKSGLTNLATPEGVKGYLDFISRPNNLGRYSLNNQMLIKMQCPEATHVGTYFYWVKQGRMPLKGRGIKIIGPRNLVKKVEVDPDEHTEDDSVTIGEDGTAYIEKLYRVWKTVTLWDITATTDRKRNPYVPPIDGPKAIPGIYTDEQDELAAQVDTRVRAWVVDQGVTIYNHATAGTYGSYNAGLRALKVCPRRGPVEVCGTMVHEAAHLCEFDMGTRAGYNLGEFVAEGTAYVILQRYGLDISGFSFRYVRGYGADQKMFQRGVDAIRKISAVLVEAIEGTGALLDAPVEEPIAAD